MLGLLAQPTLGCPTSDLRHFCPHVNGLNKRAAREEKEEEKKRPAFFILNLRKKIRLEQNFLFFVGSAIKAATVEIL